MGTGTDTHETPLRRLDLAREGELRLLSTTTVDYVDGAEAGVLDKLRSATDRSSLSDELPAAASNIHEAYHFARGRANALRALVPPADDALRVLEVGAGCGAITRWLGEHFAVVDAVEPMTARAVAARERCVDLDNVEVFVGGLEEVPEQAGYDLIVINGVLEYVAGASDDPRAPARFLRDARARLRAGGILFLAIENRLGVKYLAGAKEDHTGRRYDSIEDYPRGTHARTFSREELAVVCGSAGLTARFLHAFPDYKDTRAIFDDALLEREELRPLAWRLPHFPSPGNDARQASELRLWRSLVAEGLGSTFANSFVVLAASDHEAIDRWWPNDQRARYFNTQRQSPFAVDVSVREIDGQVEFQRRRLHDEDAPSATVDGVTLHAQTERLVAGTPMIEAIARGADPIPLVRAWREELRAVRSDATHRRRTDLLPHNCVVQTDGSLRFIDQEFEGDIDEATLVSRGMALLALGVARDTAPTRWVPATTAAEMVEHLARAAGVALPDDWRTRFVTYDCELQSIVHGVDPDEHRPALEVALDAPLDAQPLGRRGTEPREVLDELQAQLQRSSEDLRAHLELHERVTGELRRELDGIYSSREWRALERLRALLRRR